MVGKRFGLVVASGLLLAVASLASATAGAQSGVPQPTDRRFDVGMIGDFPYDPEQQEEADNLLAELNGESLAFVTHDGDIKSGSTACTDNVYRREFRRFKSSVNPFFYTPGDNEWTDCHRTPNPNPREADPLNRLALLRDTFFTQDESLGRRTLPLKRQSEDYPENARWFYGERDGKGGVTFATVHIVGSNNNRPTDETPTIGNEREFAARNRADIKWLDSTFDAAERRDSKAVMIVIQANIFEEDTSEPSGFSEFRDELRQRTIEFDRPVVLVHGDSHYFRIDKPLYAEEGSEEDRLLNFTRVETFGDADVHWVRASVDLSDPDVFTFKPEIVDANED